MTLFNQPENYYNNSLSQISNISFIKILLISVINIKTQKYTHTSPHSSPEVFFDLLHSTAQSSRLQSLIDLSPYNQNFNLGKSRQIFHHSLKEHHKISNIPKFRCEML
jgi:hypothetical protein